MARKVVAGPRCAVIADENTARLFRSRVLASLCAEEFRPLSISLPAGEKSKSLGQVERLCEEMIRASLDRTSFVIGLGGGVIGDLSGFAAAIFKRGIPHIQIPTTLLAMVDSSIGGKTGANLTSGKNLIGAFHPPSLVLTDVDLLSHLPAQQFRQGYAEIIKHGIIRDAAMLDELNRGGLSLPELIGRNIRIKSEIVGGDPLDISGERAVLNFGHTVAHGIEQATNFEMAHGDCVSLGMMAACQISAKRAGLPATEREQVGALLHRFELPTKLPKNISRKAIEDAVRRDKKFENGQVRFVVTPRLGSAYLSDEVLLADISEAIGSL